MTNNENPTPPRPAFKVIKSIFMIIVALLGIGFILWLDSWFMDHSDMPKIGRDMSYGLLLLIGFLTSFHCVGMCGPLILGYTAKNAADSNRTHHPHLLYGIGKTLSYTTFGALFGAFGSIIAFTPTTQGMVGIAAGLFLFLFGLHMLNIIPALRHFEFKPPAFLMRFIGKEYRKHSNPFMIGLLNGLMIICGPLQAMYVMAAGTGSWSQGAATLFFFGVGTLPLLMGFGFLTSILSASLTPKLLKASGVIVMALGVIMLNRGLAVAGTGYDFNTCVARISQHISPKGAESVSCEFGQRISMEVLSSRYSPNQFIIRKGIPLQWEIDVKELNECNKEIVVPQYGLKFPLKEGKQIVTFTPKEVGVIPWSCWMGMIPGSFIVVEDTQQSKPTEATKTEQNQQQRVVQKIQQIWQDAQAFFQTL
jgi:sulfite exporter TauE/SafE